MSNAKQKSVWGIALKAGTIQATQTFGSRKEAEDAIATISHLSNGFEAVELGPVNSPELPDGWIKCSERMPEIEEQYYLTFAGGITEVGYFFDGYFADQHITHWMPLPAPPTTEK